MTRKPVSIILSAALAALAPGLAPYEALAGVTVRSAGTVGSGGLQVHSPTAAPAPGAPLTLQAIAPGAVVSTLFAPEAPRALAAPVADPASVPTLSVPRRAAAVAPEAAATPSPLKREAPAARGPPAGLRTLAVFSDAADSAGFSDRKKEGDPQEAPSASFSLAGAFSLQSARFDGAAVRSPGAPEAGAVHARGAGGLRRSGLLPSGLANGADARTGSNPLSEIGENAVASGVYEPRLDGTLDVSKYEVPFAIRGKRALFLGLHYGGIAAFVSFLALGLGWAPAAVGAGAAGAAVLARRIAGNLNPASPAFVPETTTEADLLDVREDLVRIQNGEPFSEKALAALDERVKPLHAFMDWAEGAAQVLVNRAGFDGYRAPRLWFNESHSDPYAAHSSLGDMDRASSLYIGVGFLLRPLGETLAMMGHEMGHLFHGDYGPLRENLRLNPGGVGFRRGMAWAGGFAAVSAVAAAVGYAAHSFLQGALVSVDPVSAAISIGWVAAAFFAAVSALLAGFAATRQDELRADSFSAWLTHPQWWISWLRMRKASRDLAESQSVDDRTALERFWDRLMSTHPDYDSRIEALEAFRAQGVARDIPTLPSSDSLYGLNGETTIALSGMDASALEAFQRHLEGPFEAQVYFVESEGESTGFTLVRVHRRDGIQLDGKTDDGVVSAISAAASKASPGAKVVSARSKPHEVFRWAAKSRTARTVLRSLKKAGVPVRWDTALSPDGPRGIFRPDGENGPEILVNPSILLKASPKALLALIAHEAYHAGVWAKMRQIGIDWLSLGGLEFERLAHSIGLRVFLELNGTEIDDVADARGEPVFGPAAREWKTLDEDRHLQYLKGHGYGEFARLRDLRALAPADLAAELGLEEDAAATAAKIELLWSFYETELRAERRWRFWSSLR